MKRIDFAILLLLAVLTACSGNQKPDKPVITVSVPPQQYLLERIAGDTYTVQSILQPGSNPETFDPTIASLSSLHNSDAWFVLGTSGFEENTIGKVKDNFPGLAIVNIAEGIVPVEGTHMHDGHEEADPHLWVSARNSKILATNMYNQLVKMKPENTDYYTERYNSLIQELDSLDNAIAGVLADRRGDSFLIWHPSMSYFARDYGLTQLAVEQGSKEPSPTQIREIIDHAQASQPVVFFAEKGGNTSYAKNMANELGIAYKEISLLDKDYLNQLLEAAKSLK